MHERRKKNRGEVSRDVLIVLISGIFIGCFFMYYALNSVKKIKQKEKKKESATYRKSDKTDEILMDADSKVSSSTERGITFTSITQAENFKTAARYRRIKEGLSESQQEKQKAKKRIFMNGGTKLDHARKLIDRNKFDMANNLVTSVLKEGGKRNAYVRMAAYRYMADAYHGKGDVEKYSLMMYKYFKELEKNNINNEKLETIVKMKSDLMKTIQGIKKK